MYWEAWCTAVVPGAKILKRSLKILKGSRRRSAILLFCCCSVGGILYYTTTYGSIPLLLTKKPNVLWRVSRAAREYNIVEFSCCGGRYVVYYTHGVVSVNHKGPPKFSGGSVLDWWGVLLVHRKTGFEQHTCLLRAIPCRGYFLHTTNNTGI